MRRLVVTDESWLDIREGFLDAHEAGALFRRVLGETLWERRRVVLFGRPVEQPRLVGWFGSVPYRYSGLTLEPRQGPAWLAPLLAKVCGATGVAFNHVLLNRYRDGNDGMGLHADDERELGLRPVVATLSLGATRAFVIRARHEPIRLRLEPAAGTLLVMGGSCQRQLVHGVPKTRRAVTERVSLTFRLVRPGTSGRRSRVAPTQRSAGPATARDVGTEEGSATVATECQNGARRSRN